MKKLGFCDIQTSITTKKHSPFKWCVTFNHLSWCQFCIRLTSLYIVHQNIKAWTIRRPVYRLLQRYWFCVESNQGPAAEQLPRFVFVIIRLVPPRLAACRAFSVLKSRFIEKGNTSCNRGSNLSKSLPISWHNSHPRSGRLYTTHLGP